MVMMRVIEVVGVVMAFVMGVVRGEGFETPFDLPDPSNEQFQQMLADPVRSYILLVHRTPCTGTCAQEMLSIIENSPRFRMMDPNLSIYKFDVTTLYDVQDHLILDTDHGVYYLHRGETVRVDTNDMSPEEMRGLIKDLSAIVQRRIALLDNLEDIRNVNHTYRLLHIYYGETTDANYTELEIASKLTDRDIFRVEHPGIAALFKIESKGMYTYEKEHDDSIRMRSYLSKNKVLRFLVCSSREVPQEFDYTKVHTSIHSNVPVLMVYARTASTNATIKNVLKTTEHITKSHFHVYQLTDMEDPEQAAFFRECSANFYWGFILCILRARRGHIFRYIYDKKIITYDRFNDFLLGYLNKQIQPYFRSEEIKEVFNGKVQNLNLKSFEEVMGLTQPGKNQYLVMYYYKDGCDVCNDFQKTFETVADSYPDKNLIFARINLSKNEALEVSHLRIPNVHYTTGYDDEFVRIYQGDYTQSNFTEWLDRAGGVHREMAEKKIAEMGDREDL